MAASLNKNNVIVKSLPISIKLKKIVADLKTHSIFIRLQMDFNIFVI